MSTGATHSTDPDEAVAPAAASAVSTPSAQPDTDTDTDTADTAAAAAARPRSHVVRRLLQLYIGLALYGVSSALLVRSGLGLEPWNVLNQGLSELTGLSIGVMSIIVGAAVLLLWIPLRQRPGLGTVSNVFVLGLSMDATLTFVPDVRGLVAQSAVMAGAIVLNGLATGLYIAARFGPGPRDGLMTGLHRLTGRSIRLVRTGIELTVVATGFVLGGSVGVGTAAYALAIGPLAQLFLRLFAVPGPPAGGTAVVARGAAQEPRDASQEPRDAILPR